MNGPPIRTRDEAILRGTPLAESPRVYIGERGRLAKGVNHAEER